MKRLKKRKWKRLSWLIFREIYPELRQIFVFMFEKSGFKDVKINETIDFEKLYKMKEFNKIFF